MQESVIASPFGYAPHSLRSGTSLTRLREEISQFNRLSLDKTSPTDLLVGLVSRDKHNYPSLFIAPCIVWR